MPASALARLAPADLAELERLYLEGQDRYSVNDFTGAAEQWTQLLKALPENAENRAIRANVLINIIAAYSKAYRRFRMEDGRKNIEYLRDAQAIVDDYRRQLRKTHGEEAEVDGRLEAAAAELERKLWQAEDDSRFGSCLQPCLQPCLAPLPPPKTRRGCGDEHGGIALLGALVLPGFVRRRRRDVLAQLSSRLPADVVERLLAALESNPEDDES